MIANPVLRGDLERIHGTVGDRASWNDAVILVTGCAGFLGFYILNYLVHFAADLRIRRVIGVDSLAFGQPGWLTRLAAEFPDILRLHALDLSKQAVGQIDGAREARYVIHAASIASPLFYRRFPIETIDANIWGLRRLLDFYKHAAQLRGLLFFSSSEIYGDPDAAFIPTDEEYRGNVSCVGPRACYDEAKRFGETLCYVFAKTHKMPIAVARPFNNYGPGMRLDDGRLPADLATCVLAGRDISILSDGSPTRTFCYVSDAVAGYFLCLLHGEYDYFNIGADGRELRVTELAEIYRQAGFEIFGYSAKVVYQNSSDCEYLTDNPNRRCPDIRKAREQLGYEATVSIDQGVRRHLEFLKRERDGCG
jgi:UDP-glucuronate decarboxylase